MPSLSAVHRVLFNMDVLPVITAHILCDNTIDSLYTNGTSADSGRGDLARLARVCKSFHDPALDQLWHTLLDFGNILTLWNSITLSNPSAVNPFH